MLRGSLLLFLLFGPAAGWAGQASSSSAHKAPVWKRYCQPHGGFCFKYPDSWSMLGEVYEGDGVVVAPQQQQERALWDSITLALVVPPPVEGQKPLDLDGVIERASSGIREHGQDFQTLQRQERTIDHKPAQMLKVRYREQANAHDWIEEIVFIQGPENEIYSVALKCSPQNLARLEPALNGVLAGWTLPPQPPAEGPATPPSQPH